MRKERYSLAAKYYAWQDSMPVDADAAAVVAVVVAAVATFAVSAGADS